MVVVIGLAILGLIIIVHIGSQIDPDEATRPYDVPPEVIRRLRNK